MKISRGFSMIEVLITLVIIATALLGTAGLQLQAMKLGKSSEFRTQAVFLANDLSERMEGNEIAAVAGGYQVAAASGVSVAAMDCSAGSCDASQLSAWDIEQWESAIIASGMPQASWQVDALSLGNPSSYRIRINWVDRSSTPGSTGESFSYTAVRSIRSDS
jgi:type IV pilus assembly protein PilV